MNAFEKYGYAWVTAVLFLASLAGHWTFAWWAYVDEQQELGLPVQIEQYAVQTARDTLENWQSEFLQLIWQVVGLSLLLFVGSSQSKEEAERTEEKLDALIRKAYPKKDAEQLLHRLATKYPKH